MAKECEHVDGPWGPAPCEGCGGWQPTPPGPLTSWKARKELDAAQSEYSRLRDASRLFMPRWLKAPLRRTA